MNKKIKIKIIICIILFGIMVYTLSACSKVSGFEVNDLTGNKAEAADIEDSGNKVISIISTAGSIISVIVLVILGIKYMIGSVEERAEYKKIMLPYLIGAALIFAGSRIAGVIFNVAKDIFPWYNKIVYGMRKI